jgi:hypothetical protein
MVIACLIDAAPKVRNPSLQAFQRLTVFRHDRRIAVASSSGIEQDQETRIATLQGSPSRGARAVNPCRPRPHGSRAA